MWFLKFSPIKSSKKIDFKEKWAKIEELLKLKRESTLKQALIEADKLLGKALEAKRIKGETLGERLKFAKNFFDKNLYEEIWRAHKLRNKFVHEDEEILSFQIEKSISTFKKALQKLNVF